MAFEFQVLITIILLALCSHSLSDQQEAPSFKNTIAFTRRIRLRVRALLQQYNKEQLGDKKFEDRDLTLHSLPSISTEYSDWLAIADRERLSPALRDLHIFWTHLDVKRRQLEAEHQRQRAGKDSFLQFQNTPSIEKAMLSVQMDLRDLIQHVSAQLHRLNSTSVSGPTPKPDLDSTPLETSSSSPALPTPQLWSSRLQGYVILRDLGRYMEKLVREFILLETKHHV